MWEPDFNHHPLRCSRQRFPVGFPVRLEGFLTAESLSDQRWRYSWYCVFLSHCGGACCKHCCESCQSPGSGEATAEVHVPASGAVGGGLKQVSLTLESKIRSTVDSLTVNSVF